MNCFDMLPPTYWSGHSCCLTRKVSEISKLRCLVRKLIFLIICCLTIAQATLWAGEGNCAHLSLRQSLMRELDTQIDSETVISQFPSRYRDETPVPIYVLRDVAARMGVEFDAVKLDPNKPSAEWESAILLLFPTSSDGHFVMCKNVESDRVVLVDADSVPVERRISTRQLAALWDGTALVVHRRNWLRTLESLVLAIIFATAFVLFISWLRKRRAVAALAILGLLPCAPGCAPKYAPSPPKPIYFQEDVLVLKRQIEQGKTLVVPLTLRTSATANEILIKSLSTSCNCLRVKPAELQGETLGPSSERTIMVEVLSAGREVVGGNVILETGAGDFISASITGIVATEFKTSTPLIIASRDRSVDGEQIVRIFRFKEQGHPKFIPKVREFTRNGIHLELQQCNDEAYRMSPVGGEQVIEEHLWKYEIDDADAHSGVIQFEYPSPIEVEFSL